MTKAVTSGTVLRPGRSDERRGVMFDSCGKHPHEMGVALCGRCGGSWCANCLVYSFGPKKPPYCMSCAMVAGGVQTAAALPAMPRKMLKAQMKAAQGRRRRPRPRPPPRAEVAEPEPSASSAEAAYATTDWSTPWWEDRQPTAMAD